MVKYGSSYILGGLPPHLNPLPSGGWKMEKGKWKIVDKANLPFSIFHLPLKCGEGKGEEPKISTGF